MPRPSPRQTLCRLTERIGRCTLILITMNTNPTTNPSAEADFTHMQELPLKLSGRSVLVRPDITPEWTRKNPTFNRLAENYSPQNWNVMTARPQRAYTWTCPTVGALAELYGSRCPVMWTDLQLTGLFLASASADGSGSAMQTAAFAPAFAATVSAFRLTEVMLFMGRFRDGRYGSSLAAFDMRAVGRAFHHEFLPERHRELALISEEADRERAEADRRNRAAHAVSRERFFAYTPAARFGLRLRLRHDAPPEQLEALWRQAGIDPATLRREAAGYTLELTHAQMARLAANATPALLTVDDSWEL